MKVRSLLTAVGHNRTFRRTLPQEFGSLTFYPSTEGGLKLLKRDISTADPTLTRFARTHVHPGHTVWDIGANVGLFTFMAAGRSGEKGRVLAVDADTWLVGNLRRGADLNRDSRIDVLPVAISDHVGISVFHIAASARATNYLEGGGSTQTGGSREDQLVPTVSLDWLLDHYAHPPDVVKIDVERLEAKVLAGATRLLREVRPVIMIEVGDELVGEATRIFNTADYELFDGGDETYPKVDVAQYTTLAVPA